MAEELSSRRRFVSATVASIAALGLGTGACSNGSSETSDATRAPVAEADDAVDGPTPDEPLSERQAEMVRRRTEAAHVQTDRPPPRLLTNGDDERYPNGLGSFTKTLPHDDLGHVTESDYAMFRDAVMSGDVEQIDALPGGPRRLVNPGAAECFGLIGADPQSIDMPAVHSLDSAWQAADAVEVYWMALTRDVLFIDYGNDELTVAAADELSALEAFTGPRKDGKVTTHTLFRGSTRGDRRGPYLSQFLWRNVPHGAYTLRQQARRPVAGPPNEFMTGYEEWLAVQRGNEGGRATQFEPSARFIATGRDLAEYVHVDYPHQSYLSAALICLSYGPRARAESPYSPLRRQEGFVTFGDADVLDLVPRAAVVALRPAWFHKWQVHRKLRPEAFGGRLDNHVRRTANYDLHPSIVDSHAVARLQDDRGSALLPQAYPEGSPVYPSYPAGHACAAGAAVTVLKALFEESFAIPEPVVANRRGTRLGPYDGRLTIGGELNKLASNIALGRNMAGVHWRADGELGILVGEEIAITLLQDHLREVDAPDATYRLTRFDGIPITISVDRVIS